MSIYPANLMQLCEYDYLNKYIIMTQADLDRVVQSIPEDDMGKINLE